jgi:hypothetical protein
MKMYIYEYQGLIVFPDDAQKFEKESKTYYVTRQGEHDFDSINVVKLHCFKEDHQSALNWTYVEKKEDWQSIMGTQTRSYDLFDAPGFMDINSQALFSGSDSFLHQAGQPDSYNDSSGVMGDTNDEGHFSENDFFQGISDDGPVINRARSSSFYEGLGEKSQSEKKYSLDTDLGLPVDLMESEFGKLKNSIHDSYYYSDDDLTVAQERRRSNSIQRRRSSLSPIHEECFNDNDDCIHVYAQEAIEKLLKQEASIGKNTRKEDFAGETRDCSVTPFLFKTQERISIVPVLKDLLLGLRFKRVEVNENEAGCYIIFASKYVNNMGKLIAQVDTTLTIQQQPKKPGANSKKVSKKSIITLSHAQCHKLIDHIIAQQSASVPASCSNGLGCLKK